MTQLYASATAASTITNDGITLIIALSYNFKLAHSTVRAGIQGAHDLELAAAALAESVDLQLPPLDVPAHLQRAARVLGLPHVRCLRRCCGTETACPPTA